MCGHGERVCGVSRPARCTCTVLWASLAFDASRAAGLGAPAGALPH